MFHQVSWLTYFIAFALVAGVYYAVVAPVFFRKQIRKFFSRGEESSGAQAAAAGHTGTPVNDYLTYEKIRDEVTAYLEAEEAEAFKSDVLFSLASIISRNPVLQDERFRGALGKEIRRMYNDKYTDSLSEDELRAIWQA